jgi:exopolysaccharide production protein ExoZ
MALKPGTSKLQPVQVLRGVAASSVVIGHALHETATLVGRGGPTDIADHLSWGYGVDLFFVISGFIMLHTTADQFGKPHLARLFLLRRIIRIAPLYWAMTLAVLVTGAYTGSVSASLGTLSDTIASLLFIPYERVSGEVLPVLPLGWTLNYEMFFYCGFASCMFAGLRAGISALFVGFVSLVALGWFWPNEFVVVRFWSNSIIVEFLFGIGIALLARSTWRPSLRLGILLTVVAALASVAAIGNLIPAGPRFLSFGVPAAITVFAAVFLPEPSPSWILSLFVGLGETSYSLYLTHMFSIRLLRVFWFRLMDSALSDWCFVAAALIMASTVGYLVHILIETPVTRWLNNIVAVQFLPKPSYLSG